MPEEVKVIFGNIQDLKIKTQFDEKVGRVRWGFSFEANVDPALIAPLIHAQSEGIPLYAIIGPFPAVADGGADNRRDKINNAVKQCSE